MNLTRRSPLTLTRALERSLVGGALAWSLAAIVLTTAGWSPAESTGVAERPPATGSPADLIGRHDCWTGQAPAGVTVPGHVVVTLPGHDAPTYGGPRLVGDALGQVFDGEQHHMTVHAFCR